MIRLALRTGAAALALAATLGTASQASAVPILHGRVFPVHGLFGPGHLPGGPFRGWYHGPHWGGFGFYRQVPVVYGGCYVRRFVDDDGDVVIRKICE